MRWLDGKLLINMIDFESLVDDFNFLDDWDDRYKYIIDLGRTLPPYPEDERDETHKVRGCASQVWLTYTLEQNDSNEVIIRLSADSDAHIVRGLIAILLSVYSGKTAAEITTINPEEKLKPLDLTDHITPQRSNGFASMIKRIQEIGQTELTPVI